jgi:redox-sensitive bicupin YhaK (pirin superfamily)
VSNLEQNPAEAVCGGSPVAVVEPVRTLLPARDVVLGGPRDTRVRRTLPHRDQRMVGAWCFADHYGPEDIAGRPGMRVPPHPHTGLQTVSWLIEGDVLHRDSLGNEQLIRPGQLNLMTAGHGISHSEESPRDHRPALHGVQLWVALPGAHRDITPSFEHHPDLPVLTGSGLRVTILMGEMDGTASPARFYSPLVAAEIGLDRGAAGRLPLRPDFEYAVLCLAGTAQVDGVTLTPGPLLYLGSGRADLAVAAGLPSRVLLLGGEPFDEQIIMWWNLVGRTHEEIVRAREDWMTAAGRFGTVHGYDGGPLPAPAMPTTPLKPRGPRR